LQNFSMDCFVVDELGVRRDSSSCLRAIFNNPFFSCLDANGLLFPNKETLQPLPLYGGTTHTLRSESPTPFVNPTAQ